ncbi:hypothetical protein ACFYS8_15575 [Kitasatospora sp. NPDC004615]|uniref:hypothetical protein n=1 Tax=unclassified Kitasatospora TaxID=2633591 RepID=UPI00368D49E7
MSATYCGGAVNRTIFRPLLPLLATATDLDATGPADFELGDGIRGWPEQFARAATGDVYCFIGEGGEARPVAHVSLDGQAEPGRARAAPALPDGPAVVGRGGLMCCAAPHLSP